MTETTQSAPSLTEGELTEAWLARAVVIESAEAIVVTDPDGIVRLWNKGAARVFGYSEADIGPKP